MELHRMEGNEQEPFRFCSKQEYERELQKIIVEQRNTKNKKNSKNLLARLNEQYESLMEEYLRFCSVDKYA